GVVNRLWAVTDSAAVSAVTGLMGPKPVFIADGHHRYETGLKYLEERKAAGDVPDDEAAPNFCLMMLVGMSDPGLVILPMHRLVLDRLLKPKLGGNPSCKYVHLMKEVADAAAAKECQVAVLVPPATMAHVETIAGNLEKMPPKSTYFYPKLLTGLVYNSLK